jgi:hypothetical protein
MSQSGWEAAIRKERMPRDDISSSLSTCAARVTGALHKSQRTTGCTGSMAPTDSWLAVRFRYQIAEG